MTELTPDELLHIKDLLTTAIAKAANRLGQRITDSMPARARKREVAKFRKAFEEDFVLFRAWQYSQVGSFDAIGLDRTSLDNYYFVDFFYRNPKAYGIEVSKIDFNTIRMDDTVSYTDYINRFKERLGNVPLGLRMCLIFHEIPAIYGLNNKEAVKAIFAFDLKNKGDSVGNLDCNTLFTIDPNDPNADAPTDYIDQRYKKIYNQFIINNRSENFAD